MKQSVTPVVLAGICSLAAAWPQGQGELMGSSGPAQTPRRVRSLERPPLGIPVVHQGIPGELVTDGVLVERALGSEDVLRDASVGKNPILPPQPETSSGDGESAYAAFGCPCPEGSAFEGEPDCAVGSPCEAADTFNGGCGSLVEAFTPIALGDVVCGETTYDAGLACRDTDWYELVLTETTQVTWRVAGPFEKVAAIVDNAGVDDCTGVSSALVIDYGDGCFDDAVVSATLPPGTWWFFAAPEFAGDVPCGTNYTATLTGGAAVYSSEATFVSDHPGLTYEDFEDLSVTPGSYCGAMPTPWTWGTSNGCIAPGDLEQGFQFDDTVTGEAYVLGSGYDSGSNTADSIQINPDSGGVSRLLFNPPVRNFGMELEFLFGGEDTVEVTIYDELGVSILSTPVTVADSTETFWGVSSDTPIAKLVLHDHTDKYVSYGSLRYGGSGHCEFVTNESQFDTRFPNLAVEDFEDVNIVPGTTCIELGPWDETTSTACIDPGTIEPGITFYQPDGHGLGLVGIGYACGDPIDSDSLWALSPFDVGMAFDPPVTRVGWTMEAPCTPAEDVEVNVFGPGHVLIGSATVTVASTQTFFGVASDTLIESIEYAEVEHSWAIELDNVRFGTGCHRIMDAEVFDALYPDLLFEDFQDTSVAGGPNECQSPAPWYHATDDACISPGDITQRLRIDTFPNGGDLFIAGIGYGGVLDSASVTNQDIGPNELRCMPACRQVGLTLERFFFAGGEVTIDVIGEHGEVLGQSVIETPHGVQTFVGFACDEPIEAVRITDEGNDAHFIDNIRFGTTELPYTRFCVEESVPSANTGLRTSITLESQDANGDLLPFDESISGNADPNRLMMIARDAPGPANGGAINVGYFLMGTGSNTFVPPGAAGPICVAPGVKRFLPGVNRTNERIVVHDELGMPTQIQGQGFSRPALGRQAHRIGTHIGGVLGFHWSFQAWHRDSPGPANFSDAIAVDFVP